MKRLTRKALQLLLVIGLLAWSNSVLATTTTEIIGRVTDFNGDHNTEFVVGDTVRITITVDENQVDQDADANTGKYLPVTLGLLEVEFEMAGHSFRARGGQGVASSVTVYNDVNHGGSQVSDQLSYFGWDALSGGLAGYDLSAMEVGFYEYTFWTAPTMLINDGLPTGLFSYKDGSVFIAVDDGTSNWTVVHFIECPLIDTDSDGLLDSCDYDQDGIQDANDSCPDDYNPDQQDTDNDGNGDACDDDDDDDSILDGADNCPLIANPGQENYDADALGDACDDDADDDGFVKGMDCNDLDASIHPDTCDIKRDGIDQNCDGTDRVKGRPCFLVSWPRPHRALPSP